MGPKLEPRGRSSYQEPETPFSCRSGSDQEDGRLDPFTVPSLADHSRHLQAGTRRPAPSGPLSCSSRNRRYQRSKTVPPRRDFHVTGEEPEAGRVQNSTTGPRPRRAGSRSGPRDEGRWRTARLIECHRMNYIGDRPSSVLEISRFQISTKRRCWEGSPFTQSITALEKPRGSGPQSARISTSAKLCVKVISLHTKRGRAPAIV